MSESVFATRPRCSTHDNGASLARGEQRHGVWPRLIQDRSRESR